VGSQQIKSGSLSDWNSYLDAAGYPKTSALPAGYRRPMPTPGRWRRPRRRRARSRVRPRPGAGKPERAGPRHARHPLLSGAAAQASGPPRAPPACST
jgi:hypothetical protein